MPFAAMNKLVSATGTQTTITITYKQNRTHTLHNQYHLPTGPHADYTIDVNYGPHIHCTITITYQQDRMHTLHNHYRLPTGPQAHKVQSLSHTNRTARAHSTITITYQQDRTQTFHNHYHFTNRTARIYNTICLPGGPPLILSRPPPPPSPSSSRFPSRDLRRRLITLSLPFLAPTLPSLNNLEPKPNGKARPGGGPADIGCCHRPIILEDCSAQVWPTLN
ncbi:hypothetical protein PoB_002307300 [Plakobranchus ocellatus]|uniref:Uncharacterized protein n=1 Tax=Plakobranchus ocellatus TaxID=259542 RepID=A0AAV3ZPS5_9GAST|nr:hypothetical protein PoB_002307300 [Plakobranchus ocellatus]